MRKRQATIQQAEFQLEVIKNYETNIKYGNTNMRIHTLIVIANIFFSQGCEKLRGIYFILNIFK